jgi:hypothetical protein
VRYKLAIGVGPAATHLSHLRVSQQHQPVRRRQEILNDPDAADLMYMATRPALALTTCGRFNGAKGHSKMTLRVEFRRSAMLATALALLGAMALTASPARADRCDDIATQLKNQIDGLSVGITAANSIYLSHPQAKELSLGCSGRNFKNELYAKADGRKPKPAFLNLVGSAAAIIFTLPKDDALTGVTRCITRMGLLRGDTIKMRHRRLDFECSRTKTEASIAISRGTDE